MPAKKVFSFWLLLLTQGIGRATALLFARKGFNVVVAARDKQKLDYVASDCEQASGRQGSSLAGELPNKPSSHATAFLGHHANLKNRHGLM